jgi:ABC-2 type transport system ATP-binding protein
MSRRRNIIPSSGVCSDRRPMCAKRLSVRIVVMTSSSLLNSQSPAIESRGLGKSFGSRAALEGVDIVVSRGVAFGFLGANGAGKTTLIRLLLGLAKPTAGNVRVLGRDVSEDRALALARVGAIIEEPRFHQHLTGRQNLRVHAAACGPDAHGRIDASLARVGLAARADEKVKTYSLGMRQRLGLARCLLCDPELLILDEPLNGLDPAGILEIRRLIREFVDEGRTVLLSSHLLDEVEKTCDLAAIVDHGRIVAQGTIQELVNGGARAIDIGCDSPTAAVRLLAAVPGVLRAAEHEGAIRVSLSPEAPVDREIVTALLRRLLDHGVDVERVAPACTSLEDRFLTMTTRVEDRS